MGKVLFCNAIEVSHTKETFLLIMKFAAPNGYADSVYVALPPSGIVTLHDLVEKEIEDYTKKHGGIVLGEWTMESGKAEKDCGSKQNYLS